MYTHIVLWFCIFGIIYNAPIEKQALADENKPASVEELVSEDQNRSLVNDARPDIEPFAPTANESLYETLGGGFEGDMLFPPGYDPREAPSTSDKGVAIIGHRRWPNNVIPYDMSEIIYSQHRNLIVQAMNTLMYAVGTPISGQRSRKSCVYFRPRQSSDRIYLRITYGAGCSCTVGYWPNMLTSMTLNNPGCFYSGTIQHELLHALGFYHEQSRPDRDSYITVNYGNVQRGMEYNFDKYAWGVTVQNQNTPYDTSSIMHYGAYAFSDNGWPTITPRRSNALLGQRNELSSIDIAEVRDYYQC